MAINNNRVAMNDSTRSMTAYEKFLGDVKNTAESIRLATNRHVGLPSDAKPIRDSIDNFISQWAQPAAQDALDVYDRVVNAHERLANGHEHGSSDDDLTKYPVSTLVSSLQDAIVPNANGSGPSYSSVAPIEQSGSTINYLNADLAKHYGMDEKAAYSEALQNTAYRRAVADLKAAGLNPVLAASGFAPAGSYAAGDTLASGSGSGASGGAASGSAKYALSGEAYNILGVAGSVVGAVVGAVVGKSGAKVLSASTLSMLGKQIAQGVAQAASSAGNLK